MKSFRLGSISRNLYVLVILAILPALAILLYSGLENRRHSIEQAQNQILLLTHTMAEAQQGLTNSIKQMLATLSLMPQVQDADREACNDIFRSVLKQNPNYVNISLTDLNGEVIASGKPLTITNFRDRKHVRGVLKTKEFSIGEYIISRIGAATPAFAFAYPVYDKNKKLNAVLTAPVKLSHFSTFYDFPNLPKQSFVAVTDHKGIRLFYYPPKEDTNPVGKPIKATSWEKASKAKGSGISIGQGSDGVRRIFAFEQVHFKPDDTPYLYVWTGTPEANVLAPANAALTRNLILLLLATVLSLFISWLIGKKTLLSPIHNLVNLTRNFAQGDLAARSEFTTRPDELGTLTKAFHDMADRLVINQRTLRESEAKYRELAGSLPEVVFEMDATGTLTFVNQNAFDLFGYTEEEFDKGLNALQMIIPEDRNRALENIQKIMNGSIFGGLEYTALRKNGTTFPVMIHSNRVLRDNKPMGVRGLIIDLSKSRKMETDLKRLAMAMDQSTENIVITDTKGLITYVNPAFEKTSGYSREEALGKNPLTLQSGKHDAMFFRELWQTIYKGKTWSGRFVNKKKDGTLYTEEATISPVFSDKGEIVNYVAVKRDISDKLQLEAQLQQAYKMEAIGNLAGGIAHDFNNILSPIVGYTEMLLLDARDDSNIQQSLKQILTAAKTAKNLVNQILTFSRQGEHEKKPIKVQRVIKEALKLVRSSLPATIDINKDIGGDCGLILADPTQIQQIIMNLCTNAYHAMEEAGGKLTVNLKEVELKAEDLQDPAMIPGKYVCLTVADTGMGMHQGTIDRIFDLYFTTKESGKGTGLGLAVVHGIVKNHSGHINVCSEPGIGTEFHVHLPVIKAIQDADQVEILPIHKGDERILLVDDKKDVVDIEQQMLEYLGYHVTFRTSSMDALEAFRANPNNYDLVITDMSMPNMTGDKLAGELIKIRSAIPVILCTGFSERMSKEAAQSVGIKGFLMKPVVLGDLSAMIRKVLENK